jgi:hypothetical protein
MYRFKGTIVNSSKLYLVPINRGTMACIVHTFLVEAGFIALPTKLYSLYLVLVIL